jgi:glycosyltransferase involved in cell wall biosynthesis
MVVEMPNSGFVSVVVPVYHSENILPKLVERLRVVLDSVSPQWELILVNDASRDGSWRVIRSLAGVDSRFAVST